MAVPDLARAIEAARSGELVVDSKIVVSKEITIPQDVRVRFAGNGCFVQNPDNKGIVRIKGSVEAPLSQIFEGFKPAAIKLTGSGVLKVYPQWWGAQGDGVTDSTTAIQCAIDSGVNTIELPQGRYLIRHTLNFTNRWAGFIFRGAGRGPNGTIIVADTGGIALDATGSRESLFQQFSIVSGQEKPATLGILYARSEKYKFAEFNQVRDVKIQLDSIRDANNGHGTIGIYNNAAELWRASGIYLLADNPMVFTGHNVFGVSSAITKHYPNYSSMSVCTIDGASTFHAYMGSAITFENAVDINIDNGYTNRGKHNPEDTPYALRIVGFAMSIRVSGHIEGFHQVLYTTSRITGLNLQVTGAAKKSPQIYLDGTGKRVPGLMRATIEVLPIMPGKEPVVVIQTEGKQIGIQNSTIYLAANQQIQASGGRCTGNQIYSPAMDPIVKFSNSPGWFSYTVHSAGGMRVFGPVSLPESK